MKINKLGWGLFLGRPKFRWFKDLIIYIKRIFFTLKHTYPPQAQWETFAWFTDTMKEILTYYRYHSHGTPIIINDYFDQNIREENQKTWNDVLDEMISCLNDMDEDNPVYEDMTFDEEGEIRIKAKNRFFELFNKYFYNLWD